MLKLFLLKGLLIGVCSLLTSIQDLGSKPVRGSVSAREPDCLPSSGVAQGVLLIPVSGREVGVVCGGEKCPVNHAVR